jgi:hypothetical protein
MVAGIHRSLQDKDFLESLHSKNWTTLCGLYSVGGWSNGKSSTLGELNLSTGRSAGNTGGQMARVLNA